MYLALQEKATMTSIIGIIGSQIQLSRTHCVAQANSLELVPIIAPHTPQLSIAGIINVSFPNFKKNNHILFFKISFSISGICPT